MQVEEHPYGLTADPYEDLQHKYRMWPWGMFLAAAVFSPVCWGVFGSAAVGITIAVLGLSMVTLIFFNKRRYFERSVWTLGLTLLGSIYLNFCFLSPALIAVFAFTDGVTTVVAFAALAFAFSSYTRYYLRATRRALEEKRAHNEREIIDLEQGIYHYHPVARPFKAGRVEALGWDDRIGQAFGWIGVAGASALGIVLRRHTGSNTAVLVAGIVCLAAFMFGCREIARRWVKWQKLREYERQIGKPIRNR